MVCCLHDRSVLFAIRLHREMIIFAPESKIIVSVNKVRRA